MPPISLQKPWVELPMLHHATARAELVEQRDTHAGYRYRTEIARGQPHSPLRLPVKPQPPDAAAATQYRT